MPVNFNEVPRYYRENNIKADIAVLSVTPMDSKGYFNFGTNTTFSKALMEKAKIKVLEVNESMPWAYGGYDECIHISDVDYIIENSEDKITETTAKIPTERDKKIAENVAGLIPKNGPTLQIGIGTLPERCLEIINNVAHPDYRDWLTGEAINIGWLPETWANKVFIP